MNDSLSTGQILFGGAMWLVATFIVAIWIGEVVVKFIDREYAKCIKPEDEFEDRDDPYAELVSLAPHFTCHKCCDKYSCRFAFDAYCTDGDCLMAK